MYEVKASRLNDEKVLGLASIVVDERFVFNGIRIIKSDHNIRGFFLSMPSRRDGTEFKEYFHISSKEFYSELNNAVGRALESGVTVRIGSEISDPKISVELLNEDSARVSYRLNDDIVCDSIYINKSKAGEYFVTMPNYRTNVGTFKSYCHPITSEYKKELDEDILTMYSAVKTINENFKNKELSSNEPEIETPPKQPGKTSSTKSKTK